MTPIRRGAVVLLLLGAVGGLCVHYEVTEDQREPYPAAEDIDADYDRYVEETILLVGTVESADYANGTAEIRIEHDEGTFTMTLRRFSVRVEPGGTVQAYGTLQPGRTMDVSKSVVVNESGGSALYKYGVSVVGAAVILLLFFRHWRIDLETLAFEVRDDG
jgi:hypothetical protein